MGMRYELCGGCQGDAVAEGFELADVVAGFAVIPGDLNSCPNRAPGYLKGPATSLLTSSPAAAGRAASTAGYTADPLRQHQRKHDREASPVSAASAYGTRR
jgi:hypothetical protein